MTELIIQAQRVIEAPVQGSFAPPVMNLDTILAVLGERLEDIDAQMFGLIGEIDGRTDQASQLSMRMEALQGIVGQLESNNAIDVGTLTAEQRDVLREVGIDIPAEEAVEVIRAAGVLRHRDDRWDIPAEYSGDLSKMSVSRDTLTSEITELKTRIGRLNSGNEMRMIALQSLVSQRGNEVGLATKMLAAINESLSQIIQNFR